MIESNHIRGRSQSSWVPFVTKFRMMYGSQKMSSKLIGFNPVHSQKFIHTLLL